MDYLRKALSGIALVLASYGCTSPEAEPLRLTDFEVSCKDPYTFRIYYKALSFVPLEQGFDLCIGGERVRFSNKVLDSTEINVCDVVDITYLEGRRPRGLEIEVKTPLEQR